MLVLICVAVVVVALVAFLARQHLSLHVQARVGNIDRVRAILDAHPDAIAATDRSGETALHPAAAYGHTDVVRLLLARGAKLEAAGDQGQRAIHLAAAYAKTDTVLALVQAGANINAPDARGVTALHFATAFGHAAVARALLDSGANRNARDEIDATPLDRATVNARHELIALLAS